MIKLILDNIYDFRNQKQKEKALFIFWSKKKFNYALGIMFINIFKLSSNQILFIYKSENTEEVFYRFLWFVFQKV